MASYKSGLDPPARPGDVPRGRRLGAFMQAGSVKSPEKEPKEDTAHIPGRGSRRGATPGTQAPPTRLPRPSLRQASPNARPRPAKLKVTTATSSGPGSSSSKAPAEKVQPERKGKSSRNALRREPSPFAPVQGHALQIAERKASPSRAQRSLVSAENRPSIDSSMRSTEAYNENMTRPRARPSAVRESPLIIPELDRYRSGPERYRSRGTSAADLPPKLSTQDLPPPTPLLIGTPVYYSGGSSHHRSSGAYSGSGYSASSSTRFSESPGPGMYSRNTTPTSMSSQSPGIIAPRNTATPRLRQGSPALSRPPLSSVRMRAVSTSHEVAAAPIEYHDLPSLQESAPSSSSNSAVPREGKTKEEEKEEWPRRPPPTPPPRKSSQKFKSSRAEQGSLSRPYDAPAATLVISGEPFSLKTKPASTPASKRSVPPSRPSREGTPDLESQLSDSMRVVQSNLAGVSLSPDRWESTLPRGAASSPQPPHLRPRSQHPSRLPSRNPCPSPTLRKATPAPSGLGIVPDPQPENPSRAVSTRTPSPSLSNNKTRFGLFGRRTKTAPYLPTTDSKDKIPRKGPVAGTGHEGYSRYGLRARSISVASSSQESVASTRAHDPFLLQRMSPVIIAGGGEIIENRNASSEISRSESNTSLVWGRPSIESRGSSNLSHEMPRATLRSSALTREPTKRPSGIALPKSRRPSDSSDDGIGQNSIALRRPFQRMNSSQSTLDLPTSPNFSPTGPGASASVTSLDASISVLSTDSREPERATARARKVGINEPDNLEKRPRSLRKWNIFHRSRPIKPEAEARPLQVTVAKTALKTAAVPHYAMLDSSDEHLDLEDWAMDLDDNLREAGATSLSNEELDLLQFGKVQEDQRREKNLQIAQPSPSQHTPPMLLSSPGPIATHAPDLAAPRADLHLTEDKGTAAIRPSRLPQVGRIPKVVSARPKTTSPKSFSRPFARLSTVQPLTSPQIVDKESVGSGRSPPISLTPEPYPHSRHPEAGPGGAPSTSSEAGVKEEPSYREFFSFSPRKNSQATTNSTNSSSGSGSVNITAVIPEADAELGEDEVWNEYDDLIQGNCNETVPQPLLATSSPGVPFQYEGFETRRTGQNLQVAVESLLTLDAAPKRSSLALETSIGERCSALTTSSVYSGDMSARLRDALDTVSTPTTPMSFTDFFEAHGDQKDSVSVSSSPKPSRRASQDSLTSRKKPSSPSSHSQSMSGAGSGARVMTGQAVVNQGKESVSQQRGAESSGVNLRAASITVSRWLTFGHVLFGPARGEIEVRTEGSEVLVVDGLGNDDWSFYASETYPRATFTNLSPTAPPPSQSRSPLLNFPHAPPNHRQIPHPSLSSPSFADTQFPFPFSTFNTVVLRFPPALPLATTSHLMSEAFRVLKPGGYLELAILDLDMLNMGNRIRRAVRDLKIRIRTSCPHVSLGSASDIILKVAGNSGFRDLKSCKVGIPVVGAVSAASGGSSSSSSPKTGRGRNNRRSGNGTSSSTSTSIDVKSSRRRVEGQGRNPARETEERSLASLIRSSPTPTADEDIAQMVARVGRWWYVQSTLQSTFPSTSTTGCIFDDESVLRECEAWGTSFKLVVAHARKPAEYTGARVIGKRPVAGRGRGVSV
ncbi:hypothetical protein PZA11_002135 [Diplocarpon coronariae]